jgi:hypothetical protein
VRQRFVWPFFEPTRPHSPLLPKDLKEKENFLGRWGLNPDRSCQLIATCRDIDREVHALFFLYAYGKTIHNLPDTIMIYWCGDCSTSPYAQKEESSTSQKAAPLRRQHLSEGSTSQKAAPLRRQHLRRQHLRRQHLRRQHLSKGSTSEGSTSQKATPLKRQHLRRQHLSEGNTSQKAAPLSTSQSSISQTQHLSSSQTSAPGNTTPKQFCGNREHLWLPPIAVGLAHLDTNTRWGGTHVALSIAQRQNTAAVLAESPNTWDLEKVPLTTGISVCRSSARICWFN